MQDADENREWYRNLITKNIGSTQIYGTAILKFNSIIARWKFRVFFAFLSNVEKNRTD